jgi:hypothetical protein
VAGSIRSIERKFNYFIGYRTYDLPDCTIVSYPITLPRAPCKRLLGEFCFTLRRTTVQKMDTLKQQYLHFVPIVCIESIAPFLHIQQVKRSNFSSETGYSGSGFHVTN